MVQLIKDGCVKKNINAYLNFLHHFIIIAIPTAFLLLQFMDRDTNNYGLKY